MLTNCIFQAIMEADIQIKYMKIELDIDVLLLSRILVTLSHLA